MTDANALGTKDGTSVVTPSALKEAVERVTGYLDRLCKSRQYDHESIHAFDLGEPSEAVLGVADLRAILTTLFSQAEEIERWHSAYEIAHDQATENGARARAQAESLEAMASALKPFSDLADFFDSWEKPLPDTASINRATTIGHLRTARATLTQYRQGDL